jgi:hypothetical protein
MIEVRYSWPPTARDPNGIISVTLKQLHIPRVGDVVDVSVLVPDNGLVTHSGFVKNVIWRITNHSTEASVFLTDIP